MKLIESRANPLFKTLMRQFRHAGKPGQSIWLEGPHLCEMWQAHQGMPDWLVFEQSRQADPGLGALLANVEQGRQLCLSADLFQSISSVQSHQGVLMVAQPPRLSAPIPLDCATVMLDRLQDPGNVGTILRTCAAVGIKQVVCSPGTAAVWSPKVLRSAQGAHFLLQVHESVELMSILAHTQANPPLAPRMKNRRLPVLATTLETSDSLFDTTLPAQAIWLFGNEGQGVAPELLALADQRIQIEHAQPAVESLNVASAVAICLFEQWRQHRKFNTPCDDRA